MTKPDEKYQFVLDNILPRVYVKMPDPLFNSKLQAQYLGPFNKPEVKLPFAGDSIDLRLLGAIRPPLLSSKRILNSLANLQGPTSCYSAVSVAVSGASKSTTIFDVAMHHFVMYLECLIPGGSEQMDPTMD